MLLLAPPGHPNSMNCASYGRKAKICDRLRKAGAPCEWIPVPQRGVANCGGSYGCHSKYLGCGDYTCEQVCNTRSDCEWRGASCKPKCNTVNEHCQFDYEVGRILAAEEAQVTDLKTTLAARKLYTKRALDGDGRTQSTCCPMDIYGGIMKCASYDDDNGGDDSSAPVEDSTLRCCFGSVGNPCGDNSECCQDNSYDDADYGLSCKNGRCSPFFDD